MAVWGVPGVKTIEDLDRGTGREPGVRTADPQFIVVPHG